MFKKETFQTNVELRFSNLPVILTDGNLKVANIGIISDVKKVTDCNKLILDIATNNSNEAIYLKVEEDLYKLSFQIIAWNVSRDNLKSYMQGEAKRINFDYDFFDYCKVSNKVKQVRDSNTGGNFLDWYRNRKTNKKLDSYDGIWINGRYIRIVNVVPPSVEYSISEVLFEFFNNNKPFRSMSTHEVYITSSKSETNKGYYEQYNSVNGIVLPGVKEFLSISPSEIIALDYNGQKFSMYAGKAANEEEYTA